MLDPGFRVRGMHNLFVMDASIFPTSMGINPMLTIMAVADHAVQAIGDVRPPAHIEEGPAHEARLVANRDAEGTMLHA